MYPIFHFRNTVKDGILVHSTLKAYNINVVFFINPHPFSLKYSRCEKYILCSTSNLLLNNNRNNQPERDILYIYSFTLNTLLIIITYFTDKQLGQNRKTTRVTIYNQLKIPYL